MDKDDAQNGLLAEAEKRLFLKNSTNCLIRSTNNEKLIVINGLDDYIVVDEDDVLLIYPKSKEQEIKPLGKEVEQQFGNKYS